MQSVVREAILEPSFQVTLVPQKHIIKTLMNVLTEAGFPADKMQHSVDVKNGKIQVMSRFKNKKGEKSSASSVLPTFEVAKKATNLLDEVIIGVEDILYYGDPSDIKAKKDGDKYKIIKWDGVAILKTICGVSEDCESFSYHVVRDSGKKKKKYHLQFQCAIGTDELGDNEDDDDDNSFEYDGE